MNISSCRSGVTVCSQSD